MEALKAALKNLKAKGLDVKLEIKHVGDEAEEIASEELPAAPTNEDGGDAIVKTEKKFMMADEPSITNLGKKAKLMNKKG